MAKYQRTFQGNFDRFLQQLEQGIMSGSTSASLEARADYQMGEVRCAIRVFERYSLFGGNRVSLNVTVLGQGEQLFVAAITSGGSQAVVFKMNTMGEEAFLDQAREVIERYIQGVSR